MAKRKIVKKGNHWDSIKFSSNIMMDALAKHLLGLAPYKMTDVGEVLETYCQLKDTQEETWLETWGKIASQLTIAAKQKLAAQDDVSASALFLRASTYWRTALMCFSNSKDKRMVTFCQHSHDCYEQYLQLSGYPGEFVKIPYENSFLPGHFYRSPVAQSDAPLMILTPGRDTWAEDTRWIYDGLLQRGIHCLVFDGPGQGYTLRQQGLPFRPDWENVLTPVINFAIANLAGIDAQRIGALGVSFGGFLLPRACAFEPRVKVAVCDPGNLNWGGHFADIFAKAMRIPTIFRPKAIDGMMTDYAWKHGVSRKQVISELRRYDNRNIIDRVTCETLVLDGTAEINQGESQKFFDALPEGHKYYHLFDEASTAQSHAQMGGYSQAAEFLCDWLVHHL